MPLVHVFSFLIFIAFVSAVKDNCLVTQGVKVRCPNARCPITCDTYDLPKPQNCEAQYCDLNGQICRCKEEEGFVYESSKSECVKIHDCLRNRKKREEMHPSQPDAQKKKAALLLKNHGYCRTMKKKR